VKGCATRRRNQRIGAETLLAAHGERSRNRRVSHLPAETISRKSGKVSVDDRGKYYISEIGLTKGCGRFGVELAVVARPRNVSKNSCERAAFGYAPYY